MDWWCGNGTVEWSVRRVAETGSTNVDLMAAARAGAPAGTVLVADHQWAGRGRLGRTWVAPPGSALLMSVLLRPTLAPGRLHRLTQAMALAAADACEATSGLRPDIKWPNDLLIGDRKLAGILAESAIEAGRVEAVIIGMGLNLRWPVGVPDELVERAVTLEAAAGAPVDRELLLAAILERFAATDPLELASRYRASLATIGRRVRVELGGADVEGTAVDVTTDGELVVEQADGRRRTFAVGDVVHLRPA